MHSSTLQGWGTHRLFSVQKSIEKKNQDTTLITCWCSIHTSVTHDRARPVTYSWQSPSSWRTGADKRKGQNVSCSLQIAVNRLHFNNTRQLFLMAPDERWGRGGKAWGRVTQTVTERQKCEFIFVSRITGVQGAEMSQSWAVRKRKLLHIWRKSEGMTQSASEWDGEIPQAHCEHKGHADTFIQNVYFYATRRGYRYACVAERCNLKPFSGGKGSDRFKKDVCFTGAAAWGESVLEKKREKKVFYNVCYSNSWDRKRAAEWVTNDNTELLEVQPPQKKTVMSLFPAVNVKNKTDLRSVLRLRSSSQLQVIIMAFFFFYIGDTWTLLC